MKQSFKLCNKKLNLLHSGREAASERTTTLTAGWPIDPDPALVEVRIEDEKRNHIQSTGHSLRSEGAHLRMPKVTHYLSISKPSRCLVLHASTTHYEKWLLRTLYDSAHTSLHQRLVIVKAQAFPKPYAGGHGFSTYIEIFEREGDSLIKPGVWAYHGPLAVPLGQDWQK